MGNCNRVIRVRGKHPLTDVHANTMLLDLPEGYFSLNNFDILTHLVREDQRRRRRFTQ